MTDSALRKLSAGRWRLEGLQLLRLRRLSRHPELRAERVGDQLLVVGFLRRRRAGSKELRAEDLRLTHGLQVAIERRRGNPRRALIAFGHGDQCERVRDQVVIVAKEECGLS